MRNILLTFLVLTLFSCTGPSDHSSDEEPRAFKLQGLKAPFAHDGELFIIGGGSRGEGMMRFLVATAQLQKGDSIHIVPWASIEPDSAVFYGAKSFEGIGDFEFITVDSSASVDLSRSKLIYIAGGNQNRLMTVLKRHGLHLKLHDAFQKGATIAGTSAGAAVMSEIMITGDQVYRPDYEPTFAELIYGNGVYDEGLGLLKGYIIDQHFVERSRYNRLISALADFPGQVGIGIGESTAAIIFKDGLAVAGEGQVVIFSAEHPPAKEPKGELVHSKGLRLDILKEGESVQWTK